MTDRELLERTAKAAVVRKHHGMNKSPEHRAWVHMRQRCSNPNRKEYTYYGARGITVCSQWSSFSQFFQDIGKRPSPGHSIDRIDVNGNYEPGNVRWATKQQQAENTRIVRMVTIGSVTQSISAWEREKGLPCGMVRSREVRGWTIEDAICVPSVPGQKRVMTVQRDHSKQLRGEHGRYKAA